MIEQYLAAEASASWHSDPLIVVPITIALIAASAFFVAVEFSIISARRHRLEDDAAHSPAARAALRNSSDIQLLLAGAQLGITLCTLALGSVTKPAVHHWLMPLFTWLPTWSADVVAFVLALIVVTFIHLVVGEMAPKSWSIAHPERSATMLALPMRAFLWVTRPLLVGLNGLANAMLHRIGVETVDEVAAGQNADSLRELVRHSGETGTLEDSHHRQLLSALELQELALGDLLADRTDGPALPEDMSAVAVTATPEHIRDTARETGHLRLLVLDGSTVVGVVHVRDSLRAQPNAVARDLMRPCLSLRDDLSVAEAFRRMREARAHLVVIEHDDHTSGAGVAEVRGVVTLDDVVRRLLPVVQD